MFETSSKMTSFPPVNEEQPQNGQNPTIIIQNPSGLKFLYFALCSMNDIFRFIQ